jgi:hypothetical protein
MVFLSFLATYASINVGAYSALLERKYLSGSSALLASVWPITALVFASRQFFLLTTVD